MAVSVSYSTSPVYWNCVAGSNSFSFGSAWSVSSGQLRLLFVSASVEGSYSVTGTGWYTKLQYSSNGISMALFYNLYQSGHTYYPTVNFSASADGKLVAHGAVLSGVHQVIPFDDQSSFQTTTSYTSDILMSQFSVPNMDVCSFFLALGCRGAQLSGSTSLTVDGNPWTNIQSVANTGIFASWHYYGYASPPGGFSPASMLITDGTAHPTIAVYQGILEYGHPWPIFGSTQGQSSVSGSFSAHRKLDGQSFGVGELSGPFTVDHRIAGVAFAPSLASGPLTRYAGLEGPAYGESYAWGSVVPFVELFGSVLGSGYAEGLLLRESFSSDRTYVVPREQRFVRVPLEEREISVPVSLRTVYVEEVDE